MEGNQKGCDGTFLPSEAGKLDNWRSNEYKLKRQLKAMSAAQMSMQQSEEVWHSRCRLNNLVAWLISNSPMILAASKKMAASPAASSNLAASNNLVASSNLAQETSSGAISDSLGWNLGVVK